MLDMRLSSHSTNGTHRPRRLSRTLLYQLQISLYRYNSCCSIWKLCLSQSQQSPVFLPHLFLFSEFYQPNPKKQQTALRLTNRGYDFILSSRKSQIQQILAAMIAADRDLLVLVFKLPFSSASPFDLGLAPDALKLMAELGLLHIQSVSLTQSVCWVSSLLTSVSASATPEISSDDRRLFVETTSRVEAIGANPLICAILSLFCAIDVHSPALFIGTLTKHSVQRAIVCGITVDKITAFLDAHLHPKCKFIPYNVLDQLKLWQHEKQRYTMERCALFHMPNAIAYDQAIQFCLQHPSREAMLESPLVAQSRQSCDLMVRNESIIEALKQWCRDQHGSNGVQTRQQ